MFPNDPAVLN